MPDTTARLGLPVLAASQAQKHVTHNEALQRLDGVTQLVLTAIGAETPPLLPVLGDVYALGLAPGGSWAGQGGRLAQWQFGQWLFLTPQNGWRAWDQTAALLRVFQGGTWLEQLQNLDGLGIGTVSDTQNRLAIAAPASLFSHTGAGHQLKINKAAAGDTASLLYQSAWTGHTEMGLTGDNDFHLKTSADGNTWTEALVVEAASGTLSGAAIQANVSDATAKRLMAVGAFGLGNVTGAPQDIGNIDATTTPEGTWAFTASTTGALPPPFAGLSGQVGVERYNATITRQIASINSGTSGIWWRSHNGTTWESWRQLFDSHTVLGTVSQAGGVPTGAVIERGSNANGEYVRFADGTQICLGVLPGDLGADKTWTLPAAFANALHHTVGTASAAAARIVTLNAKTASTQDFSVYDLAGNRTGAYCTLNAIGRWF